MPEKLLRFILLRVEDVSGSSGTGVVARGVVYEPSGWVVLFFRDSFKFFPSREQMMRIHSHEGRTRFHWQDRPGEDQPGLLGDLPWIFKEDAPPQETSESDWYALQNGYIDPEQVLVEPHQIAKVREAEAVLRSFFEALERAGLRPEM